MNKEDMIKELNMAVKIIGSLPVTHEAQDIVVATKQKIRNVIAELERMGNDESEI